MLTPETWFWWGLGWLCMPHMTIGILLVVLTPYHTLELTLAIIGGIADVGGISLFSSK